jgi:ubiquinol-cytochrome c reductase iron-sulfur subunit
MARRLSVSLHGSKYDLAGRVFKGMPAPLNLPVHPYSISNHKILMIGENSKGENFALSSVEQMYRLVS